MANESRREIVKLLRKERLSINGISKKLKMPIAGVVYHVDKLKTVGILESEYEKVGPGRFRLVFYVNEENLRKALQTIEAFVHELKRRFEEAENDGE